MHLCSGVISQGKDAGINMSSKMMQLKFKSFLLKKGCRGDPSYGLCPPLSWGARGPDWAHVEKLLYSFCYTYTQNEEINMVRMVTHDLIWRVQNMFENMIENNMAIGHKFLSLPAEQAGHGPYSEAGMHSMKGLVLGQQRYPNNEFFKMMTFNAYLMEDTPENRELVAQLSLMSNEKHLGKGTDFKETITRMITQTEEYIEEKGSKMFSAEAILAGARYELTKGDMDMFFRRWCTSGDQEPDIKKIKYQRRYWKIAR